QCMSLPPMRLFSVLVSLGRTNSVVLTNDSWGLFFFLAIFAALNNPCQRLKFPFCQGCHKNQKKYFGNNCVILLIRSAIMKTGHIHQISRSSTASVGRVRVVFAISTTTITG